MIRFNRRLALTLLSFSSLALGACSGGASGTMTPTTTMSGQAVPDAALTYGEKRENFTAVERLYNANPNDDVIASRYAKVLRESGDIKKAKLVIDKVVAKKSAPTLAYTEQAALYLETSDFTASENAARHAIKIDNDNYRAWHILGIALDAQQKHPEAETAFEKALSLWQGDSVPVMNNLALNLAAQGYTDRALAMLYDAQKKDPSRIEIERNIRIIRTLNEPAAYTPQKH